MKKFCEGLVAKSNKLKHAIVNLEKDYKKEDVKELLVVGFGSKYTSCLG